MQIDDFSKELNRLQKTYNHYLDPSQIQIWWEDLKGLELSSFKNAIDKTIIACKQFPSIAELRANITARKMNLNSSYFYANFKDIRPYFDIITGEPLEPFN